MAVLLSWGADERFGGVMRASQSRSVDGLPLGRMNDIYPYSASRL